MFMSKLSTFLAVIATSSFAVAQDPPVSTSNTFVLYPYITAGSLTGPYSNADINRVQPLALSSGREAGTWTEDCFNRFTFTDYIGTHCYGQDQCGFQRWSLNRTHPELAPDGDKTIGAYSTGIANMLIAAPDDIDDQGRRDVGWTASDCGNEPKTLGFSVQAGGGDKDIFHLVYENQYDDTDLFGTFFACWVEGNIYGPKLFYRNVDRSTPEGCAELLLVPRCTNDTALGTAPVAAGCYWGGLPA